MARMGEREAEAGRKRVGRERNSRQSDPSEEKRWSKVVSRKSNPTRRTKVEGRRSSEIERGSRPIQLVGGTGGMDSDASERMTTDLKIILLFFIYNLQFTINHYARF